MAPGEATQKRIADIEQEMLASDFWQDKERAQALIRELQELKAEVAGEGKYDKLPAILSVYAGAGGDDAEDFSAMLLTMYRKYLGGRGWGARILHTHENDHGGYRNVTIEIEGKGAYGELRNESGVHRLVRVSPFNAKELRHTSFALVEVVPKLPKVFDIPLPEEELDVSFARSSGPGGQNVNKRETAVRIVHKPTGISVHADSERAQAQNKEKALEILRGKIFKRREEDRRRELKGLSINKGQDIEWGNQIRSYVLHPYQMVKDHRTGVEVRNSEAVLAGDIQEFIDAERALE